MDYIILTTFILSVLYVCKKMIDKINNKNKKIKEILETYYTRNCANCEFRDRLRLAIPFDYTYCKDGSLNPQCYCCKMHKFNNKIKEEAEYKLLLNNK